MPQEDDRLELRSPRVSDYASGISRPPTRAAEAAAAEAAAAEAAAASALQSTSRTATDHVSQASDGGSTEASLVSSGGPAAGPLERRGRYGSGRALERGGRHLPRQRRAGGARHDPRLLPIRLQAGVARLRAGRLYVHRRRAGRPHARHAPPQVKSELKSKQVKTMEVVPVFKRGRFDLLSGDPPPYPTTLPASHDLRKGRPRRRRPRRRRPRRRRPPRSKAPPEPQPTTSHRPPTVVPQRHHWCPLVALPPVP